MYIEEAALKEILETSAITAIVADRVFYVKAPQDVQNPYIVLQSVSNVPVKPNHAAASGRSASRIQVSIFATTYKSCKEIAAAVKTVLNGFKGEMGGTGGVAVGGCFLEREYDLAWEDSLSVYGIGADYMLYY